MLEDEQEEGFEAIPFWEKWLEADKTKRIRLIENSPIIQEILGEIDNSVSKNSFILVMNTLFEDLESTIYAKIHKK